MMHPDDLTRIIELEEAELRQQANHFVGKGVFSSGRRNQTHRHSLVTGGNEESNGVV